MSLVNAEQNGRLHFLDNLRSFTIVCVVFLHAALAYTYCVPSWWQVIDNQKSYALDLFVVSTEVFWMPLLFFIAGYFAVRSLARRSKSSFMKEKFKRIVAPWILGVLFLAPLIQYFYFASRNQTPSSYLSYYFNTFFGTAYTQSVYWFLGILALFFFLLLALYYIYPSLTKIDNKPSSPPLMFSFFFILIQSIIFFSVTTVADDFISYQLMYLIEVRVTRLILYASYFFLGVYAYKQQWFTTSGYAPSPKFWLPSSILILIAYTVFKVIYFTKMDLLPVMAGNSLLFCSVCHCMIFCMLAVFYKWANFASTPLGKISGNSYAIYYIHMPIVLAYNLIIRDFTWNVYIKYSLVVGLSLITSYIVCEYVLSNTPFFKKSGKKVVFLNT